MGRQKNVPKKRSEENWSVHDGYIPIIRKNKQKKKNNNSNLKMYNVLIPNENNEQFYAGDLLIGTTNNCLPLEYKNCKVVFKVSSDEVETLSLKFNDCIVIVKLITDIDILKEIIVTKAFALWFDKKDEDIFLKLYFLNLPLQKFYPKIGNCIKTIFKLLFNIYIAKVPVKNLDLHGNSEILNLYKKLSKIRDEKYKFLNEENPKHPSLKPDLRPYQEDAVRWMLYREKIDQNQEGTLHPLYTKLQLKSGLTVYFDKYSGFVELEKPVVPICSKGGILADEMGLGKTVEVLACILCNQKHPNSVENIITDIVPKINKQDKKRKIIQEAEKDKEKNSPKKLKVPDGWVKASSKKSATRVALETWYNNVLREVSSSGRRRDNNEPSVQCICGVTTENGVVECDSCGKYQHSHCLGYSTSLGKYLCSQCWMEEPLFETGATLIVTPVSLRSQWCKEICKHIQGNLRVLQYEGYSATPIYPTQLKDYDVVLTTYNVLQAELRLTETGQVLNLRKEKKYSPPGSPLVRVKWWRLCLDEAQTVETPGRMVSTMAKKIDAHLRWAITGTPISKNISDIYGLIDYLQLGPYNDFSTWKNILYDSYERGEDKLMIDFLSCIFWRSSKNDVINQINIPKQTYEEHFLEFSAVEKYFYKWEHELSCNDFLVRAKKLEPSLLLEKMDRGTLKKVLAPLLTLRHSCTHPNTTRGRYLATKKKVSSRKDLLDALILKNTGDSEEALRLVISSLNGLAGIYLLLCDPQSAINHYRRVLQLTARFSDQGSKEANLTVDKLQIIHAMFNLDEVLSYCQPEQPTLRDSNLKEDCEALEQKYLEKFLNEMVAAYETSTATTATVEQVQGEFALKEGQWYSDGLDWVCINNLYPELLERINNTAENASVECSLRSVNQRSLLKTVFNWNEDVYYLRSELLQSICQLYEHNKEGKYKIIIKDNLVDQATNCHLRPVKKSKSSKCPVCVSNDRLKSYEVKLFSMTQRKKLFEEMSLLGSWKQTLEEIVLKALLAFLKIKNGKIDHIKDGEVHSNFLEALKKEFREIRKFWRLLDQQICAQDELKICKVRLQLKDLNQEEEKSNKKKTIQTLKNLTYTVENKLETVNEISVYEIDYQHSLLKSEVKINMDKLEKMLGTYNYLETLKKQQYEGQSPDPCPICKNPLELHWSILLCGHSYCLKCIQLMLERTSGSHIQCSVCRNKQKHEEISYIKAGNSTTDEDCLEIKGNYSTKIEALVKLVLMLKKQDPKVKVLMFSSWITVLKCIKEALEKNNITYQLGVSSGLEIKIDNFKDIQKNVTVLLLPVNLGSKGLNLIEATHVILVEPLLNPADELQAVGRVHRIGQTKPTVVHKFLIKNTIEESIYQATTSNSENWDKNKVTLQQLMDLFLIDPLIDTIENSSDRLQSDIPTENSDNGNGGSDISGHSGSTRA